MRGQTYNYFTTNVMTGIGKVSDVSWYLHYYSHDFTGTGQMISLATYDLQVENFSPLIYL